MSGLYLVNSLKGVVKVVEMGKKVRLVAINITERRRVIQVH